MHIFVQQRDRWILYARPASRPTDAVTLGIFATVRNLGMFRGEGTLCCARCVHTFIPQRVYSKASVLAARRYPCRPNQSFSFLIRTQSVFLINGPPPPTGVMNDGSLKDPNSRTDQSMAFPVVSIRQATVMAITCDYLARQNHQACTVAYCVLLRKRTSNMTTSIPVSNGCIHML